MQLSDPVTALPGIGPVREAQLEKLQIRTVFDLLSHFPRDYDDRSRIVPIASLRPGTSACVFAEIISAPQTRHPRRELAVTTLTLADESGRCRLVLFNQAYRSEQLKRGSRFYFYGDVTEDYNGVLQLQPSAMEAPEAPAVQTRTILPVYSLTAGLKNSVLVRTVGLALSACGPLLPELLPRSASPDGMDRETAYRTVHRPESFAQLARARNYLAMEERFLLFAGLRYLRQRRERTQRPPYQKLALTDFYSALPYAPTAAQRRAIGEIADDFSKPYPMCRLLQGDVGSGKTLVAAAALVLCVQNGEQAALMAPTELLAQQHARTLGGLFDTLGLRWALLNGSLAARQKQQLRSRAGQGELDVLIGTQALLSESTAFARLGLVITDEQHRFGVAQRLGLQEKGVSPHVLLLSATPIPRTLAQQLYGDMELSVLDERPAGRQKVDTFLVREALRPRINAFIRKQVAAGRQVYIICPAVEQGQDASLASAEAMAESLRQTVFRGLTVGLVHGQMQAAQKQAVMEDFAAGRCAILVATTVVEVGVDVPNATLIVIENAERFGLAQLHQLRGRVGRGREKSYCVLFSEATDEKTLDRLRTLCRTDDGFAIAEEDLRLRGPGDFFGERQSGLPVLKTAAWTLDEDLAAQAQRAAQDFAHFEENQALCIRLQLLLQDTAEDAE